MRLVDVVLGIAFMCSACGGSAKPEPGGTLGAASAGASAGGMLGLSGSSGSPSTGDAAASGTLGISGSSGAPSSGDAAAGGSCPHNSEAHLLGMGGGPTYAGPGVIERSTVDELVVYFAVPSSIDASAEPNEPVHSKVSGLDPMPIFPVGAKVWLSQEFSPESFYGEKTFKFELFDSEGGALLLGAGYNGPFVGRSSSWPAPVENLTVICQEKRALGTPASPPYETVTYYSVDVMGDTKVSFGDGDTKPVTLAGIAYDASVRAVVAKPDCCVNDAHATGGVLMSLVAHDIQSRIAQLEVGDPPACAEANARGGKLYLNHQSSLPYDGPGVFSTSQVDHLILTPGSQSTDTPQGLTWSGDDPQFPTLTPGVTYWATLTADSQEGSIRVSEHGPYLVASIVDHPVPDPATSEVWTEPTFEGVAMSAEPRCTYRYEGADHTPVTLYDVTFGTEPPVKIKSGGSGTVTLGGSKYTAWVDGVGSVSVTLHAQ